MKGARPGEPGLVVLASRSPRRRALLEMVVPAERLRTLAPTDPSEESLEGLNTWREIEAGMGRVAAAKRDAVLARIAAGDPADDAPNEPLAGRWTAVIAADTAVIAGEAGGALVDGSLTVLGQPPDEDWEATVRRWFRKHYVGRTHVTATAVSVAVRGPGDPQSENGPANAGAIRTADVLVHSRITVRADAERHLDRLFAAAEPPGRAGGVAIAGLFGALLVERVDGSLSNVSGLPLRETLDLLAELGVEL
ncbi:Maf family protein [Alienimonas chondri]|nr:Maf family protein [Alienimonas chondri]